MCFSIRQFKALFLYWVITYLDKVDEITNHRSMILILIRKNNKNSEKKKIYNLNIYVYTLEWSKY